MNKKIKRGGTLDENGGAGFPSLPSPAFKFLMLPQQFVM
jgi:hypothetical protein